MAPTLEGASELIARAAVAVGTRPWVAFVAASDGASLAVVVPPASWTAEDEAAVSGALALADRSLTFHLFDERVDAVLVALQRDVGTSAFAVRLNPNER